MNLVKEIIEIVEDKLEYFWAFKQIADLKGKVPDSENKMQSGQFKTEKWLQAELAAKLYLQYPNNITIIPEFRKAKWDLYVKWKNSKGILVELKCFSASAQNPNSDFRPIKKDIQKLAMLEPDIYRGLYFMILPQEGKYKDKIEENIKSEITNLKWKANQEIL